MGTSIHELLSYSALFVAVEILDKNYVREHWEYLNGYFKLFSNICSGQFDICFSHRTILAG